MMQRNWTFHTLLMKMQNGTTILKNCLEVSYKLKDILTYGPVILLLSIYPEEIKMYAQTKPIHKYL